MPVGVREIPGVGEKGELEGGESVKFSLRSEDGDEGYPGTVDVSVVYTAGVVREGGKEVRVLGIEYEVKMVGDEVEETVVNVTNHSYVPSNPTTLLLFERERKIYTNHVSEQVLQPHWRSNYYRHRSHSLDKPIPPC